MTECDRITKYFNIIDNKYICTITNTDPKQYFLKNQSLNFEISKDEYSEWKISKFNKQTIDLIKCVIMCDLK